MCRRKLKEYSLLFIFTLFSLPCHTPRWPSDALAQHQKTSSLLCAVRNNLGMKKLGVCSISCDWTYQLVLTHWRQKTPLAHLAWTQQVGGGKAQTLLQPTCPTAWTPPPPPPKKMLSTKSHMHQLIRKETEIELHPNSINKEDGLDLKEAM